MKLKGVVFILVSVVLSAATAWAGLTKTEVSQLYVSIFNRASEGEGNTFWQSQPDMATAAAAMLDTGAAKDYFGSSLDTHQAFIEHIYLNTLNKTIADDAGGISYWVGLLDAGTSRGNAVAALVGVIKDYAPGGPHYNPDDAATVAAYNQFTNRVEVSDYMADTVEGLPDDWATSTVFSAAGLNITSDAATVDGAKAFISSIAKPVDPPEDITSLLSFAPTIVLDSNNQPMVLTWRYRINAGQPMQLSVEGIGLTFHFEDLILSINPDTLIRQGSFSGSVSGMATGNFNVLVAENIRIADGKTLIDDQNFNMELFLSAQGESIRLMIEVLTDLYTPAEWFLDREDLDRLPIGYTYDEGGVVSGTAHANISISGYYGDSFSSAISSSEVWTIKDRLQHMTVNGKTYDNIVQVTRSTVLPVYENGGISNKPADIEYWVAQGIGMIKGIGHFQLLGKELTVELLESSLNP